MNKEIVVQLLQATLLSDHSRVQAESQVQSLTREKGFSTILLDIFGDQSIDKSIRNLSVILFKNIITNNWRRKDNIFFSEEEREDYKNRVLILLNNPNETCKNGVDILAGVVGTMARVDFPSNWPNLLTNLLELFEKSSSEQIKITSLKTIKFVVKELASRRFVIDRNFFNQFSNTIFNYFIQIWRNGIKRLIELMIEGGNLAQHESFFIMVYYVSKILRRVVEYGYSDYQNSPEICQYFSDIFTGLPEILKLRTRITNPNILLLIDRFVYINQKTIIKSQLQNPLTFINLLLPSLRFFVGQCLFYNPHDESKIEWNTTEDYQSVMTQSVNFLKQVIDCSSYQGDYLDSETDEKQSISSLAMKSGCGKPNGSIQVAQNTIKQFFNKELLGELLKALVSHYLIINREEFERWEDSPEEYIQELQVKDPIYELKPSAYNLFILLMRHFHQDSVSIVVSMLEFVTSPTFNSELTTEKICLKEACYMTIGLGYHDLMDIVNFSQVFMSIFVGELHNTDERFKIIKRRILWLVSYWVGKIPENYKESVVKLLLEFLKNQDIVIALTALDALKSYIDDFSFDCHSYQPYLKETLELVIRLFSISTNETTKSNLLSTLASIFVKFNESIKPFSTMILQLFQHLWNGGKEQPIVKSAVLRSFSFFLQALNSDPADFYTLLFPIIDFSISQEDEKVYLLEDGLELWYRTMVLVPSLSQPQQQPLIHMFKRWFTIIAQSLENCEICFKILDTYLLLGQVDFLKIYGVELSSTLFDIIGDIGEEYTEVIIKALMRIIQVVPNPQDSVTLLIEQCLFKILSLIISRKETNTLVLIEYFSIFSRIMTMNPLSFFQLFDRYPMELLDKDGEYYDPSNFNNADDDDDDDGKIKEMPQNKSQLFQQFFEIYFVKVDSTGSSDHRKLIAIGLSNLLAIPREEVYPQISEIITTIVGIRADISDITHDDIYCDDGNEVSGVQIQSDRIFQADPLTTVDLSTYLYQKIQECSNIFGAENFQKAIENVHPSILSLAIPQKNN
ncbi:hypothetical protein RB653_004064 [Dictyostelium firmibasis]|uniref:Importin N-terminal domain-containing protein n=1 Tax=Dictyostelium firmibasis TaxID=79012 RepID=A0AAN7TZ05_9MYCE